MIIHQIFWKLRPLFRSLEQFPRFKFVKEDTERYCKEHKIGYKLWSKSMVRDLIKSSYPQYQHHFEYMLNHPVHKFAPLDFARFLILHSEGGIYIDLDIDIIKVLPLTWPPLFFASMRGLSPYQAIMGSKKEHPFWLHCAEMSKTSYYKKLEIEIYKKWKCRFTSQTTGSALIKRALKKFPDHSLLQIVTTKTRRLTGKTPGSTNLGADPYFYDTNDFSWA